MTDKTQEFQKQFHLAEASLDEKLKRFYCNGVLAAYSPIDVTLLLKNNSTSVALISMALPVAKDLIQQLQEGVAGIEKALGQEIISGQESQARVAKNQSKLTG